MVTGAIQTKLHAHSTSCQQHPDTYPRAHGCIATKQRTHIFIAAHVYYSFPDNSAYTCSVCTLHDTHTQLQVQIFNTQIYCTTTDTYTNNVCNVTGGTVSITGNSQLGGYEPITTGGRPKMCHRVYTYTQSDCLYGSVQTEDVNVKHARFHRN